MVSTPIEDRLLWKAHRRAADMALRAGLCWWGAQVFGLSATDEAGATPRNPCACRRCQAASVRILQQPPTKQRREGTA